MVELFRFDLPRRIGRNLDTYTREKKKLQEAPGAFIYEIPAKTTFKNTAERFVQSNVLR
jgi:hypothetical protein